VIPLLKGVNHESVHVHLHVAGLAENQAKKQIDDQQGKIFF